ncbi:MAG TPA: carboxylesterase/lipase family protein [Acidimicrobiales bacterium]
MIAIGQEDQKMTKVDTTAGTVVGMTERKVLAFKGIPFAAAPVGARRFLPPQPVPAWTGERNATQFGALARQSSFELEQFMGGGDMAQSEDCLTLNVWTPAVDDARRPVLFWIHGGAFFSGGAAIPWYNGGGLARRGDAVVVSCQYRMGAFGFLQLRHLLGDDYSSSGNLGILDQIAALEWVRDNIAGFGGDPSNVTVFGESAGGMSIGTLLGTPAARGLFHRAIAQSGAAQAVSEIGHAEAVTAKVIDEAGLTAATAHKLLEIDAETLNAAQDAVVSEMFEESVENARRGNLGMPFQPVHDGVVLPDHPLDAVRRGDAAGVPLLIGTTKDEMRLFTLFSPRLQGDDESALVSLASVIFGSEDDGRAAFESYRSRRPGASPSDIFNDMLTDYVFRIPAIRLAEAQSAHQPQTRMYRFSWEASIMGLDLRAFHGIDILFCFDNVRMPGMEMIFGDRVEAAHGLGANTSEAWLAFARSGDPSHHGLPAWPAYDTDQRATMDLDAECSLLSDPGAEDRALWDGVR